MSSPTKCSVRFCQSTADGKSPITDQPYCTLHLQVDVRRCEQSEADVADKITNFKKYQTPLRLMQQRMASDLLLLDESFDALQETLKKHKAELTAAITQHHENLMSSLKILDELEDFQKELREAKDARDTRLAFLLTENMNQSLETLRLDSKLVCMDEETGVVQTAAFPDVNSAVLDADSCADVIFDVASRQIERLDVRISEGGRAELFVPEKMGKVNLVGTPSCFALCSNTSGFTLDESNRIVRAEKGSNSGELPQPTVFVAVELPDSQSDSRSECNEKYVIQLVCPTSAATGRLSSCWEASQPIRDLHCDSDEQLLFIAQDDAVIVTDLCGVEQATIATYELQQDVQKVRCIAGDSDKLFVLAELADGKPAVFGLSKKSREIQLKHTIMGMDQVGDKPRMFLRDRMLFLSDGDQLHAVCSITGMLILSFSLKEGLVAGLNSGDMKNNSASSIFCQSRSAAVGTVPFICLPIRVPSPMSVSAAQAGRRVFLRLAGDSLLFSAAD